MGRFRIHPLALITALAATTLATAQMRVVNYNVAQLNGNLTKLEDVFANLNDDDWPGWAKAPDVYLFQEVNAADTGPLLTMLNNQAPAGVTYELATYTNTGEDCCAGAQACFYRTDTITEQVNQHQDIFTGAGRDADRWRLRYLGYNGDDAKFYVYSAHLKAGSSGSDEADRDTGAQAIRANADALGDGQHIIYAGDFNLSENTEAAYQTLLALGNGKARDPYGTGTWAGSSHAIKHTQSPRLATGTLVGGGMDDRYDFQMVTGEFRDDEGYSYIVGTYRAFGNDGNHYNQRIDNGTNTYYPGDTARSGIVANNLFGASDHIPVVADYQLPAWMEADLPLDFGRAIQGSVVTVDLEVTNAAPVIVQQGADELDYDAVMSGALSGTCSGSVLALDPPDVCSLQVDTSTVGMVSGTVDLTSTSQAVTNPALQRTTMGSIVRASVPSFSDGAVEAVADVALTVISDTGSVPLAFDVFNNGYDADQALLDVDSVGGLAAPFSAGGLPSDIGATAGTVTITYDSAAAGTGDYLATLTLNTSDEDLPGEGTGSLTLDLTIHARELVGDVNGDCVVDLSDLAALLATFGTSAGDAGYNAAADFDGSGAIDLSDLASLLASFGQSC